MNLTIALAQMVLDRGKPEVNFIKANEAVQKASLRRADLILLPELWASGFDLENCRKYASSLQSGWFSKMQSMAVEHRIAVGGSMIEEDQGKYFNTFVFYDREGKILGTYRKIHLFGKLKEDIYFESGTDINLIDSPWGKIGLAICYDLRFPEIFRSYAVKGAEVILLVAEWPQSRIGHWNTLLQARAIENQCFIAAVNKVGLSEGKVLGGGSAVISPMGEIMVQGGTDEELLYASIDLKEVAKNRRWMPIFEDRKPAVYQ